MPVAARYRWVGLELPEDEIMPSRRIDSGYDDVGTFFTTRTETKQSRFFVDLKLYVLTCALQTPQANTQAKTRG